MKSIRFIILLNIFFILLFACKKQVTNNIDNRDNIIGLYRYSGSVIDTSFRINAIPPASNIFGNHNVNGTIKIEKSNSDDSIIYLRRVIQDRSAILEGLLFETDPGYAFYQADFNGKKFSDSFITAKLTGDLINIPKQIAPFTGGGLNGTAIYIEGTAIFSNNQMMLNYSTKNTFGNHWYSITAVK